MLWSGRVVSEFVLILLQEHADCLPVLPVHLQSHEHLPHIDCIFSPTFVLLFPTSTSTSTCTLPTLFLLLLLLLLLLLFSTPTPTPTRIGRRVVDGFDCAECVGNEEVVVLIGDVLVCK